MHFYGVTLALVSPVKPELVSTVALGKIYRSVQSFSATISSGSFVSDWVIEFGLFVTFLSW